LVWLYATPYIVYPVVMAAGLAEHNK
jgi:hypothetical protein